MSRITLAMLALAGAAAAANACDGDGPGCVHDFVKGSELAFRGEVVGIRYANSTPAVDAPDGIPHTFVTYRVDQVMHGAFAGEELTLRFMGGYDPATQTYLDVSLAPEFDLGDEDFLFVRGNGTLGAPLVGNHDGRFRISGGQVYSDTGRSIHLDDAGHISMGDRYGLPEVGSVTVLGHTLWIGFDPDANLGESNAISAEAFAAAVRMTAAISGRPRTLFSSSVYGQAFSSPFPTPQPMRDMVADAGEEEAIDPEILAEILADESGLAEQYLDRLEAQAEQDLADQTSAEQAGPEPSVAPWNDR